MELVFIVILLVTMFGYYLIVDGAIGILKSVRKLRNSTIITGSIVDVKKEYVRSNDYGETDTYVVEIPVVEFTDMLNVSHSFRGEAVTEGSYYINKKVKVAYTSTSEQHCDKPFLYDYQQIFQWKITELVVGGVIGAIGSMVIYYIFIVTGVLKSMLET